MKALYGLRRLRRALLLLAFTLGACAAAWGQEFPSRPLRLIVPFGPGGSSDLVGRLVAKELEKQLGQSVVVDNKPGAAAMIGLNELVQAKPDGYTIGIANSGMVLQPLYGQSKFNYPTELQALAQVGDIPFVLVVSADSPWKTIEDFLAHARANPRSVNYGVTGIGNTSHIGPAHLQLLAKAPMEAVTFGGGAALLTSLLGGHIQAGGTNPVDIKEHVKGGRIRTLLVFGDKRLADPLFADVPTAREKGFDVVVTLSQGIGAPKNLPEPVKRRLADALLKTLSTPAMQESIRQLGLNPNVLGADEFARKWLDEQAHFHKVVTDTGILQLVKQQK